MLTLKTRNIALLFTLSFGGALPATANDAFYSMGVASAKYVGSVTILQNLSSSECGYAIKQSFNSEDAIKEVAKELTRDDRLQLIEHFNSEKFKKDMKNTWNELIVQPLHLMQEDSIDLRTACGILIGGHINIYQQSKHEWEHARQNYRKTYAD